MSANKTVILITGCSRGGIGFALSEEFASRGCTVYATARRVEAMKGFAQDNIHTLALDVTNDQNVHDVVETIVEREGRLDVLVNNAGIGNTGPVIDVDMQEIIRTFDANVFSVIRMAKAVIPHMAARKSGTIVNVGSIAGDIPVPWGGIYGSSKAAVHSLSDTLYMECKPFNIHVLLLAPGGVKSNIAANQLSRFELPENSLYAAYVDSMLAKLHLSQSNNPMPAEAFSRQVADAVLKPAPPRYMSLATMAGFWRIMWWLPRTWVLSMFWRRWGEGRRLATQKQRE
ncbi:NAD-P-binding protein [Trametes punicea]|nr:NAD-P-binding protein [Trametes punicea]